jgi:hypothetical protein
VFEVNDLLVLQVLIEADPKSRQDKFLNQLIFVIDPLKHVLALLKLSKLSVIQLVYLTVQALEIELPEPELASFIDLLVRLLT